MIGWKLQVYPRLFCHRIASFAEGTTTVTFVILLVVSNHVMAQAERAASRFMVIDVTPTNKTVEVELDPLIQIHVSEKFDPSTINEASVTLTARKGTRLPLNVGGDLGGVITASVTQSLKPATAVRQAAFGS